MPYYNGRKFMREAVESVLNQTYPNIEIIVVNDASPDKEDAVYVEKLADEFGFKLIKHSTNKGISQTMADAFEESSGDFIAELSQDDLYKARKIEKQMHELSSKKLDVVYAAGDILYQKSGKVEKRDSSKTKKIIESGTAAEVLKLQNLTGISIQGLLAKRSVFEKDIIPIWREYLLDDWPVNIRLFERYRVGFIEEPLWIGRSHTQHTSRNIWKWLGPQIEVAARLTPAHMKAEAIGNRLASTARRLQKQNGDKRDIIRLAFAGLMLTDSPEQHRKAIRVLRKNPSKDRKSTANSKKKLLETKIKSAQNKSCFETTKITDWENLGKNISDAVAAHEDRERLHEIGKIFFSLAKNTSLKNEMPSNSIKTALAALMLMDNFQDEQRILEVLQTVSAKEKEKLIKEKCRLLKVHHKLSFKSLFLK